MTSLIDERGVRLFFDADKAVDKTSDINSLDSALEIFHLRDSFQAATARLSGEAFERWDAALGACISILNECFDYDKRIAIREYGACAEEVLDEEIRLKKLFRDVFNEIKNEA